MSYYKPITSGSLLVLSITGSLYFHLRYWSRENIRHCFTELLIGGITLTTILGCISTVLAAVFVRNIGSLLREMPEILPAIMIASYIPSAFFTAYMIAIAAAAFRWRAAWHCLIPSWYRDMQKRRQQPMGFISATTIWHTLAGIAYLTLSPPILTFLRARHIALEFPLVAGTGIVLLVVAIATLDAVWGDVRKAVSRLASDGEQVKKLIVAITYVYAASMGGLLVIHMSPGFALPSWVMHTSICAAFLSPFVVILNCVSFARAFVKPIEEDRKFDKYVSGYCIFVISISVSGFSFMLGGVLLPQAGTYYALGLVACAVATIGAPICMIFRYRPRTSTEVGSYRLSTRELLVLANMGGGHIEDPQEWLPDKVSSMGMMYRELVVIIGQLIESGVLKSVPPVENAKELEGLSKLRRIEVADYSWMTVILRAFSIGAREATLYGEAL